MRSEGLLSPRGLVSALVLAAAGLALAWACVRATIVRVLPPNAPAVTAMAPNAPNPVLGRALLVLAERLDLLAKRPTAAGGAVRDLPAPTLAAVRGAATVAPLDARPYLILGYHQLASSEPDRAVRTFEAGQRLNPRDRFIHLLLLERYLVSDRYADAARQFSVLARLIGAAQPAIATIMAQMVMDPTMRDAARQALRSDPKLERAVLIALAKGDGEPADIFALASPAALADMGDAKSWGPVLVTRLVDAGRYRAARDVWRRLYKLPDSTLAMPIFNPRFEATSASPPFNWTLTAGGLGAADPQRGTLSIDYYGRDSGELASQLLVLNPGRYALSFRAEGGKPDGASRLFWTIACAGSGTTVLVNVAVPMTPAVRQAAAVFSVPAGCPAQSLALRGEAGEFPSPLTLTIHDIAIRSLTENKP